VPGTARSTLAALLAVRYIQGASLDELTWAVNRSTDFVRQLVLEAGVTIRPGEQATRVRSGRRTSPAESTGHRGSTRHRGSTEHREPTEPEQIHEPGVESVAATDDAAVQESERSGYTAWEAPTVASAAASSVASSRKHAAKKTTEMPRRGTVRPATWEQPAPMARVQPEGLDWSWQEALVYDAEVVLELYVQGRSVVEVAAVTGYPADRIWAWAVAAGVARPEQVETVIAAQRSAARQRFRKVDRLDLLCAWVDGIEVEELAAIHSAPPDLVWDLIAGEMTRLGDRRKLGLRPDRRLGNSPACGMGMCRHACTRTCAGRLPSAPTPDESAIDGMDSVANRASWPPTARLEPDFTLSHFGKVIRNRPASAPD
jgi:hypothetical protein